MEKNMDDLPAQGVAPDVLCNFFSGEEWRKDAVAVPREMPLTIYLNGKEMVTILCTPTKLTHLVLGFLYSEGIIAGMSDIASMRVCEDESLADVRLNSAEYTPPLRRTLTSGCGSGVSLEIPGQEVDSDLVVMPEEVLSLMKQLYQRQNLFKQSGGMHCSALCDRKQILVIAEDIGRHNTLDRIIGECMVRKLPTRDRILLTTGRVTSEMLLKAARMQTPIIVSRGTPTDRAISFGHDLGITIIGYARDKRLTVFSAEERLEGTG